MVSGMALPGGWCDPTEVVKPGEGQCEGLRDGEVGDGVAGVAQRVARRLLGQAPHLLLHLQTLFEKFSFQIPMNFE